MHSQPINDLEYFLFLRAAGRGFHAGILSCRLQQSSQLVHVGALYFKAMFPDTAPLGQSGGAIFESANLSTVPQKPGER